MSEVAPTIEVDALTLAELCARPDAPVDLAALLIVRDFQPDVDVAACLAELDRIAAPVVHRLRRAPSPEEQALILGDHLYGVLGFRGNTDQYYDPRNSYLDQVVGRRTGIPISLAVVLLSIARRAETVADGIGFPGHFLARVGGARGVYVDPFTRGRILCPEDLSVLTRRYVGDPSRMHPSFLEPVDTHAMAVRMLANLKHAHERRGDHASALVACDRLVDLTQAPEHRRDRGLHVLALGGREAAIEDLHAYLDARPTARDVPAVHAAIRRATERGEALLH